ncbi:MAG: CoA-binding protein [Halanaerobiales bacterium]
MKIKKKTMDMKNWAVIGATKNRSKFGFKIVEKLKKHDYQVFPINPNYNEVAGLKCYNSIKDISEKIDVVDMVVNPYTGINIIKEVNEAGIEYVWLQPGARSKEIKEFAEKNNIKVVEDCIYASLS